MNDLVFLKALREKLKGGNTRSIHLNALPGRFATRLDLAGFNTIDKDLSRKFLDLLLNKVNFEFDISFDTLRDSISNPEDNKKFSLLSKRLNSITIENDDNFKEHGIKTFGFGFPLLIKRSKLDSSKVVKSPIFIWKLEISKSSKKANTWTILRNKSFTENGRLVDEDIHSVGLNEVLLSYLRSDENVTYSLSNEEVLDDSLIDKKELLSECVSLLKALSSRTTSSGGVNLLNTFDQSFTDTPEGTFFDNSTQDSAWIHFGGIFGLYKTQKESIINDYNELIDLFEEGDEDVSTFQIDRDSPFSSISTDPSQQEILSTLGVEPRKIIQGPPGTGKSQTLTALVLNALANELKCLIVCEKKTALDVIRANLFKVSNDVGMLSAIIEDIHKDRDGIVNSFRERCSAISSQFGFNEITYISNLRQLKSNVQEINDKHTSLSFLLYQGKNWTNLVGEYLQRSKSSDFSLLRANLDHSVLSFMDDGSVLEEYRTRLSKAQKLHKRIDFVGNPLGYLDKRYFEDINPRFAQDKLYRTLNDYKQDLTLLIEQTFESIQDYREWYKDYIIKSIQHIILKIDGIKMLLAKVKDFEDDRYETFSINQSFKLNFLSIFLRRYKDFKQNRLQLKQDYDLLISELRDLQEFKTSLVFDNPQRISDLEKNLLIIESTLSACSSTIDEDSQSKSNGLDGNSVNANYSNVEKIHQLIPRIQNLIISLKESGLFESTSENFSNLFQSTSLLSEYKSRLNVLLNRMDDFKDYFDWFVFNQTLSDYDKKLIRSLVNVGAEDWANAFESWYLYCYLSVKESELEYLPKDSSSHEQFKSTKEKFDKSQISVIVERWVRRQHSTYENSKRNGYNPISLFNKRGSRGERRNSLRKIVKTDFDLFTSFFPVIMVNPSVCSSIIPLKKGSFDLVIFDEASQLRLEDVYPSLIRGKIKIVSGDTQQMPPSNFFQGGSVLINPEDDDYDDTLDEIQKDERNFRRDVSLDLADSESLLVYAENSDYKQSFLRVHYRSNHPALINFSNCAFYGKKLIPMPAKMEYRPINYIQVNGVYDDQVNYTEALRVIDILHHHILPFEDGSFPSVGVATFNLYQRNLIIEEINKLRQSDTSFDNKMVDLGSSFFVKNLENIQGDERDVIILSTTFGRRNDGTFRQNFGPILQGKGYKLLNVIITRAKYKVIVVTSIPEEYINSYTNLVVQKGNTGRGIFYAYLSYANSISRGLVLNAEATLDLVYEHCPNRSFTTDLNFSGSESPFEEEVFNRLANVIDPQRITQQYQMGGFRIDIVIKSQKSGLPVIALECDGAKYHSSNEAYSWDIFRQSQLEKQGLIFYRIWSTNWWNNSNKELEDLKRFILNFDYNENSSMDTSFDPFYSDIECEDDTLATSTQDLVNFNSTVKIKNPSQEILIVSFTKSRQNQNHIPDKEGRITLLDTAPLALALLNKKVGDICKLSKFELYYEILEII
jgi:very-short-patch-repair endonuclease